MDAIPADQGNKTIPEIMDHLALCSYKANRGYGCTHEQLLSIGLGNDAMKQRYENFKTQSNGNTVN
jgi:hypothetical protein